MAAWNKSHYDVKSYWAQVEAHSGYRVRKAYQRDIEHPEECSGAFIYRLTHLLVDWKEPASAYKLIEYLMTLGDMESVSRLFVAHPDLFAGRGLEPLIQRYINYGIVPSELTNGHGGALEVYELQAELLYLQNRHEEALALLQYVTSQALEQGDQLHIKSSQFRQALLWAREYRRPDTALELLRNVEALCGEDDKSLLTRVYSLQASIYRGLGCDEEALACLRQEESLSLEAGDLDGLADSYNKAAYVSLNKRRMVEAAELWHKAGTIYERAGCRSEQAYTRIMEAMMRASQPSMMQEACDLADEAYELANVISDAALLETITGHRNCIKAMSEAYSLLSDEVRTASADRMEEYLRPRDTPRHWVLTDRELRNVGVPEPNAALLRVSEQQMKDNLDRQRRRTEYEQDLATWHGLPWWKRLSVRKPSRP